MTISTRLSALALVVAFSGVAHAQPIRPELDVSTLRTVAVETIRACAVDVAKRCGYVHPADTFICLDTTPVLSTPCVEQLDRASVLQDAMLVCGPDIQKYCVGVPIGRGRIMTCLGDYQDEVSEDCYTALQIGADEYRDGY